MTEVVVDASTALAWCFPDETSGYADSVLFSLEGTTMLVPSIWGLKWRTLYLSVGERSKRLRHWKSGSFWLYWTAFGLNMICNQWECTSAISFP